MEDFQPRFLKQMWKVSSMRCGWAVGFSCMGTKYSIPHFNSCIRDLLENVGLNGERGTRARALKALGSPPPSMPRPGTSEGSAEGCYQPFLQELWSHPPLLMFETPRKNRKEKNSFIPQQKLNCG